LVKPKVKVYRVYDEVMERKIKEWLA